MVTVVCTEKGLAYFGGYCSCKERCCGVVLCCHWRTYSHWLHMDPRTEVWEMSTKCKEFCKFTKRGTRSKLCVSTSLDKALKVNGPFLIISACVWPENTRAETCKKTQTNQPEITHLHKLFLCVPITVFKELPVSMGENRTAQTQYLERLLLALYECKEITFPG